MPHDLPGRLASVLLLGKFGLKHLLGYGSGEYSTRTTLLLALLVDLLAHHVGLHSAIGAYMAGLIIKEEYFICDGDNSGENQYEKHA